MACNENIGTYYILVFWHCFSWSQVGVRIIILIFFVLYEQLYENEYKLKIGVIPPSSWMAMNIFYINK